MYIHEVIKNALKVGGVIRRKNYIFNEAVRGAVIEPTEILECCNFVIYSEGMLKRDGRAWSPTAEDLQANDWEVLKVSG
ncbi:MAG: hypothetical protein Q4B89_00860 [Lachnospiraceae bacterium]|nr:hypothetical protein [Lachnospiraceae bacterium]